MAKVLRLFFENVFIIIIAKEISLKIGITLEKN
jgi:hypothetical protein